MDRMTRLLVAALGAAALVPPSPGEAQLLEVRQTVFGMDCAPCAYAVERRMSRLDGAVEVQLSLNEGFARVRFDDAHGTTLEEIRREVRDNGFGAREARIQVRGSIVREGSVVVLRTPIGDTYRIRGEGPLPRPDPGTESEVTGRISGDRDEAGRWFLDLDREG